MEKNVTLAIILSFVAFWVWSSFIEPPVEQPVNEDVASQNKQDVGGSGTPTGTGPAKDKSKAPARSGSVSVIGAALTEQDAQSVELQNSKIWVSLSPRGAAIGSARLKKFTATAGGELEVVDDWHELIHTYEGGMASGVVRIDGHELSGFLEQETWRSSRGANGEAIFTLDLKSANGSYRFTKTYSLDADKSRVSVEFQVAPLDDARALEALFWFAASGGVFPMETAMVQPHSLMVKKAEGEWEVEEFDQGDLDEADQKQKTLMNQSIHYVCDMGEYFGVYLSSPSESASGARTHLRVVEKSDWAMYGPTRTWSELAFNLDPVSNGASFDIYLGPKDHRFIKAAYSEGESREAYLAAAHYELTSQACCSSLGPLGWIINLVSMAVLSLLAVFYDSLFGSMGVSIIFLTFCVRVLLFPITRKSQASMHRHQKKMAKLKPQLDKLKEKHKDDKQKFAQEQFKLMKQEKLSMLPLGGCLPLFLQMPIFFGLFSAIRFDVDLRHASFLWAGDLSRPDAFMSFESGFSIPCCIGPGVQIDGLNILPILMTIAWVINQKMMPKSPDPQVQQQQKMMMFMPIMFGFMMYSYAAGLSLYWLTSSLFGSFEQRVIKKIFPLDKDDEEDNAKALAGA